MFSLLLSFQLILVFLFFPLSFFFPWRSLKFLHGLVCHILTSGFMSCFERSSTFQDAGETLIQILFSFYFNEVRYALLGMYVNMYVCMCIHVGSFSLIKQHVFYYKGRGFLKNFLYHLQFILVQGVRQRSNLIFQEDRQLIPCWLLNNLSFRRYENTSEMKLNSITIKHLVCLHVWALCML